MEPRREKFPKKEPLSRGEKISIIIGIGQAIIGILQLLKG